jgi:predicted Zn-dependent protease with MMP-like domain/Flp pilus assembly protein TadD
VRPSLSSLIALLCVGLCAGSPGCRPQAAHTPVAAPPAAAAPVEDLPRAAMRPAENKAPLPDPRPLVRCFAGDDGISPPRPLEALLDRAADLFEGADFPGSLACAEEAARAEPRSVEAHHDRAAALQELRRFAEAQDAFSRALALDPDDPETLAGAADFYINRLPPSNDHTETGLELARRGSRKIKRSHDHSLMSRLALLEGQALNDLGRSREALSRLDAALAAEKSDHSPGDVHILYERAVALFELCRFDEARRELGAVIARNAGDAWAHHHLALVLERVGDATGAEREFARARTLAPADFRAPVLPTQQEFRGLVDAEVGHLPAELRKDLDLVQLQTADLPDLADLTAEEPPLSPTILGLYRGTALGDPGADPRDPRTIVIYRKNLGRAVASRDELVTQIRTTLLHELGHLRGEDDDDLRARGLE